VESTDRWDMRVLEGSRVDLVIRLSRPPAEAMLVPIAIGKSKGRAGDGESASAAGESFAPTPLPLALDGATLTGHLPDLRASGAWRLVAKAQDGIELGPQRLTIRVQPDQKAQIRFIEPEEEWEVTPTTEVAFTVEADDDLGLFKVGVACQVGEGPLEMLWERDFHGSDEAVRDGASLRLEDHPVTFQEQATYYAFAEDNYFGQRRRTTTPLRFVDIRPFKRAYQMLDTGGT
jgi:hypothetical protein